MDLEEIRSTLAEALKLRVPRFSDEIGPRERASALGDYLLISANVSGALVEARHWLRLLEEELAGKLRNLEGYEAALSAAGHQKGAPTKSQIMQAKRLTAPHLFDAHAEGRNLRGSVDDQIERLKFEAQFVISRAYTIISGS